MRWPWQPKPVSAIAGVKAQRPCQICQSDQPILNHTPIGHLCVECRREIRAIARLRQPAASDALMIRDERKAANISHLDTKSGVV